MTDCLIGYTGFVGGALHSQQSFSHLVNSKNSQDMVGRSYGTVVCCGASAVKWQANKAPERDRAALQDLVATLSQVQADRFVLISTVDVYPDSSLRHGLAYEDGPVGGQDHHAYGRHRLWLEEEIARLFPRHHILRLPALFGPGLKKNPLFDMAHARLLAQIDPEASFSWYDLTRLTQDIATAIKADLPLVNLAAEPVSLGQIRDTLFPGLAIGMALAKDRVSPLYDLRTRNAEAFGGQGAYLYGADETLLRLVQWASSLGCVAANPDLPALGTGQPA